VAQERTNIDRDRRVNETEKEVRRPSGSEADRQLVREVPERDLRPASEPQVRQLNAGSALSRALSTTPCRVRLPPRHAGRTSTVSRSTSH